jgi:hypothetical protein
MSRGARCIWADLKPFAEDPTAHISLAIQKDGPWRDCFPLRALLAEFGFGISANRSCVYQFMESIANGTDFDFEDFGKHPTLKDADKTGRPTYLAYTIDTGIRISILNYMCHNPQLIDAGVPDYEKLKKNLGDWCSAYNYLNDTSGNNAKFFADWLDLLYVPSKPCSKGEATERNKRVKDLISGKYANDDALTERVDAACGKLMGFCAKHPLTASETTDESDIAKMFFLLEDYYIKAGLRAKADSLIGFHLTRLMSADLKGAFAGNANPDACARAWMCSHFPLYDVIPGCNRGTLHYPEIMMGYYDRLNAYARDIMPPKDRSTMVIGRSLIASVLPAFVNDFRYWTAHTDRYDDAQIDGMIDWYNARRGNLCDLSLIRMIDKMPSLGEFSEGTAMRLIGMLEQNMPLMSQCVIDARRCGRYYQRNYGREKNMMMWLICYYDDMPARMRSMFAGTLAKYIEMTVSPQSRVKTVMSIVKANADSPLSLIAAIGEHCRRENNRSAIAAYMLS